MNLFRQVPAHSLSEWLDLATGNLVPSAQARIRAEIETHYAEAVQAYLQDGFREIAAQAAALADLGDAYAAARRFGREHLTENDAAIIAGLIKKSPRAYFNSVGSLVILFLAFSSVASSWLFRHQLPAFEGFKTIVGFCLIYALDVPGVYIGRASRRAVAAIDPPPSGLIQLIRIHFLINLILGVFCMGLNGSFFWFDPTALAGLPLYFAVFFFSGYKLLRLRKKLQLLGMETPPLISDGSAAA